MAQLGCDPEAWDSPSEKKRKTKRRREKERKKNEQKRWSREADKWRGRHTAPEFTLLAIYFKKILVNGIPPVSVVPKCISSHFILNNIHSHHWFKWVMPSEKKHWFGIALVGAYCRTFFQKSFKASTEKWAFPAKANFDFILSNFVFILHIIASNLRL